MEFESDTTFKVPNFTGGSVPLGWGGDIAVPLNYYFAGSLPRITAEANPVTSQSNGFGSGSGAFTFTKTGQDNYTGGGWNLQWGTLNFDASRSSSAYVRTDNLVIPRGRGTMYIIKY